MHIEFLVEDISGQVLLEQLIPRLIGNQGDPHTWKLHHYKGVGRIPKNLRTTADPAKRILLDQLPRLLKGYGNTPGIDAVVVVLDSDDRDCKVFLQELHDLLAACHPAPKTMFRLAIEEMEAWYFGDANAIKTAYPQAKQAILDRYIQDSVCGTWEVFADAVHSGGSAALKKAGWMESGKAKSEWAAKLGEHMAIEINDSPSFAKFRDGVRRLIVATQET